MEPRTVLPLHLRRSEPHRLVRILNPQEDILPELRDRAALEDNGMGAGVCWESDLWVVWRRRRGRWQGSNGED